MLALPHVKPAKGNLSLNQGNSALSSFFIVPVPVEAVNAPSEAMTASHWAKALGVETPIGGRDHHQGQLRKVLQGMNFLSAIDAEYGSADEKEIQVAAYFGSNTVLVLRGVRLMPRARSKAEHCGHGVRRGRTHASLHWQLLLNGDDNFAASCLRSSVRARRFCSKCSWIERHARIVATNLDAVAFPDLNPHDIMQRNGLVDGAELVKTIGAGRADLQAEINFGEGTN